MKRRILRLLGRVLLLLGPLVLLLGFGVRTVWRQREVRQREATELWLQNTVIPEIDWKDQTLAQCVQWLNERVQSTPGHPRGLHIAIATPEETARRWRRQVLPIPESPQNPRVPAQDEEKITVRLEHIPLREALRYASGLGAASDQIEAHRILFYLDRGEPGTFEPLVSKTFRWDPVAIQYYRKRLSVSGQELGEPGKDMRPYLAAQGLTFYEDCSAEFNPETVVLHLRSTPSNIDLMEETMIFSRRYSWWERMQVQWEYARWQFEQWRSSPAPTPAPIPLPRIPGLDPSQP